MFHRSAVASRRVPIGLIVVVGLLLLPGSAEATGQAGDDVIESQSGRRVPNSLVQATGESQQAESQQAESQQAGSVSGSGLPEICLRTLSPWVHPECLPPEATFWEETDWSSIKRDGWSFEATAGAVVRADLGELALRADNSRLVGEDSTTIGGAAEIRVGFRRTRRFDDKGLLGRAGELAWCMPYFACGGIGGFLAPGHTWIGNDHGLDLVVDVGGSNREGAVTSLVSVGLRPILAVARETRFRTASWVGSVLPEVGLRFVGGDTAAGDPAASDTVDGYLRWHPYPIDMRLGRSLSLNWDGPVVDLTIPTDGANPRMWVGTGLTMSLLLGDV